MLRNGTRAPLFSLSTSDGSPFSLEMVAGSPAVIIFHRGKFCPTTDRFLTAYQDFYGRLKEMKISLVAVSTDSVEDNRSIAENLRIRFPLLSDPDFKVCGSYGMYRAELPEGRPYAEPGVVITDIDGNVAYSVISSGPKGLPSPGDLAPILLYMHFHGGRY